MEKPWWIRFPWADSFEDVWEAQEDEQQIADDKLLGSLAQGIFRFLNTDCLTLEALDNLMGRRDPD